MTISGQILQYFLLQFMTFSKIVGIWVDIWKSKNRHINFWNTISGSTLSAILALKIVMLTESYWEAELKKFFYPQSLTYGVYYVVP